MLCSCVPNESNIHGYIEGDYIYIAPTSSGILQNLLVKRGDKVKAGDTLFALQTTQLKAAIANSKAEIKQAEANLFQDKFEFDRAKKLLITGTISQAEFEKRESKYNFSLAKLDGAKQSYISNEQKLIDSFPKASSHSYVEDTFFLPGEFIQAGSPVVSLFIPASSKARFFIPQNKIAKTKIGQSVIINCDGCSKDIKAHITYIASRPEYTPPVIYSKDAREKLVFMVEAKPKEIQHELHPGLPVDIRMEDVSD